MASSTDLTARVKVDGARQAAAQLDDVAEAADKVEEPIELTVDAKVSAAMSALRDLVDESKSAAQAADALGRALGPELSSKVDLSAIVVGFEKAGLSIDEITAKADELGAQLREVAGPTGENMDVVAERMRATAKAGDELSDSARGANSALANMIGNSAQDLGELGGIAGSAGVAVGQMAEYFSDATLAGEGLGSALKSMITVAGPIAAISLIVQTLTGVLGAQQAAAEASAQRTEDFGDAMRSAGKDALGLIDSLRSAPDLLRKFDAEAEGFGGGVVEGLSEVASQIPLLGSAIGDAGQNITDLVPILDAAGLSAYDFAKSVQDGGRVGDEFSKQLREAQRAGKISEDQWTALTQAVGKYGIEALKAKERQALFNVDVAEANDLLQSAREPLEQMGNEWATLMADMSNGNIATQGAADAINALADGLGLTQEEVIKLAKAQLDENMRTAAEMTERATAAAEEYARVLGSADWSMSGITSAVDTFTRLGESQFALTNIAKGQQAAYDDLDAAIKANGDTFDLATDKGRANAEQIQNLYSSLLPSLAAAYENANGSVDSFASNMDTLRSEVFAQLDSQTSLSADQINAVIDQLGAFDGSTYSSQFEMLGVDDANSKLALLSGVIGSLPEDVQRQVTLSVLAGDPQAALDAIETSVSTHPVSVPTAADTSGAAGDIHGFASGAQPTATVDTEANTKPATSDVDKFAKTQRSTDPVKVDANTAAAVATIVLLYTLAARLQPVVTVTANTDSATHAINSIRGTRVPVDAYLSDYPSASEIAARIGRPRIPVDIVVGQSIRITGVRE